jgi:large subunit ribosomal protein L7A
MEPNSLKQADKFVTGSKQTIKAIEAGTAVKVILASDAEEKLIRPIIDKCAEKNIPISYVDTMVELGKACGIKVGAAMAAILS